MKLIIVESPTKAKTISGFLGKDFEVVSSNGHVRDLPKSFLGINIEKNFYPSYVVIPKAKKTVKDLKTKANKAETIILATDEDREGEAIAWHLVRALGLEALKKKKKSKDIKIERIVFHEITKKAIETALKNPRDIDRNLVDAQQARRILDRLVGYKLSPFLWQKIAKKLSAGRVQSVALRIIADREKEIDAFKPEEYYVILAKLEKQGGASEIIEAQLEKIGNMPIEKPGIKSQKEAGDIVRDLEGAEFKISEISKKELKKNSPAPFITSTFQQEIFRKFRFNSKVAMMVAQKLYEGIDLKEGRVGLITYMRTDSFNVSKDAQDSVRDYIVQNFGKEYLPASPNIFKKKSKMAQEAHEAIRPTDPFRTPDSLKDFLTPQELKIYTLIWQRFVASQMKPAIFNSVEVLIKAKKYIFSVHGSTLKFAGFLKVYPSKFEEVILPELKIDEVLNLLELKYDQKFTKPPARFNDASLIKILEKYGIGRPSTYAPIISTIIQRGYVAREENKVFKPTEIGIAVNNLLAEHFPQIVDYDFTAKMEGDLDKIADGKKEMADVAKDFYGPFHKLLLEKYKTVKKEDIIKPEATNEVCDKCGAPMVIRFSKFGRFLACSKYPDCKNTKSILVKIDFSCPECGADVVVKNTKRGRKFYGCGNYPKCKWGSWTRPKDEKIENSK